MMAIASPQQTAKLRICVPGFTSSSMPHRSEVWAAINYVTQKLICLSVYLFLTLLIFDCKYNSDTEYQTKQMNSEFL